MTTVAAEKKQKFTAYASLKSMITLPIEASSQQEANEIAQYMLYDFFIQNIKLDVTRVDEVKLDATVRDWFIEVEDVFED
jgi:hypothetical protein